jgi:2-polyprenyl-3-methyl-5-hydroxy-6-metoxy-1,4-benzoquinol methylase
MTHPTTNELACEQQPVCIVCGTDGDPVHSDLVDRLFGVPGKWTFKQCHNPACGLVWLDPRPTVGDIGRAYAKYYTHGNAPLPAPVPGERYLAARRGYLASRFGYTEGVDRNLRRLGRVAALFPGRRAEFDFSVFWLPARSGGRLLDVGCGDGWLMDHMASLGWQAEGLDFDEQAVAAARRRGLQVHLGSLFDQRLPEHAYDAITLSHVVEHVHDPEAWLRECRRILRPGGQLVAVTPNNESFGHRCFGANWRGLEPPRHLQIFSRRTLSTLAERAGLTVLRVFTTARDANGIFMASSSLAKGSTSTPAGRRSLGMRLVARLFLAAESTLMRVRPDFGEEVVLIATK